MVKLNEIVITLVALIWFLFNATNVNPTLGLIYVGFASATLFLLIFDKKKTINLEERTDNRFQSLGVVIVAYAILLFGAKLIVPFIAETLPISELLKHLQATTPALAESKIINFLTFAFFVAYIETQFFFVRLTDFISDRIGIKINKQSLFNTKTWLLIGGISLIFLFFHITAKGITNNIALTLVFFMAVISMILVFWFREGKQASGLHIFANTLSSL